MQCIPDADIYLLDDTLSAVDSKVGQRIFQNCFSRILADRLPILVTHEVQYLENADHILVLDNRVIISEGTYSELSKNDDFFSRLITDAGQSDDQRSFPSASSDNRNTELFYRPDDLGVERAVEDKVKGAVSLDVYWQYIKEGEKAGTSGGKSMLINESKHPPLLYGISSIRLEVRNLL